jgi:hypothetical protein
VGTGGLLDRCRSMHLIIRAAWGRDRWWRGTYGLGFLAIVCLCPAFGKTEGAQGWGWPLGSARQRQQGRLASAIYHRLIAMWGAWLSGWAWPKVRRRDDLAAVADRPIGG